MFSWSGSHSEWWKIDIIVDCWKLFSDCFSAMNDELLFQLFYLSSVITWTRDVDGVSTRNIWVFDFLYSVCFHHIKVESEEPSGRMVCWLTFNDSTLNAADLMWERASICGFRKYLLFDGSLLSLHSIYLHIKQVIANKYNYLLTFGLCETTRLVSEEEL